MARLLNISKISDNKIKEQMDFTLDSDDAEMNPDHLPTAILPEKFHMFSNSRKSLKNEDSSAHLEVID